MAKAKVVINEQHSLLPEQEAILNSQFGEGNWELLKVPSQGWNLEEQREIEAKLLGECEVVFASPVPVLMGLLIANTAYDNGYGDASGLGRPRKDIFVFHNDNRDKKELPNGKIIFTVAKEGWQLVKLT